jgi:hypothetical protein
MEFVSLNMDLSIRHTAYGIRHTAYGIRNKKIIFSSTPIDNISRDILTWRIENRDIDKKIVENQQNGFS